MKGQPSVYRKTSAVWIVSLELYYRITILSSEVKGSAQWHSVSVSSYMQPFFSLLEAIESLAGDESDSYAANS